MKISVNHKESSGITPSETVWKNFILLMVFAVAMGFLEGITVVYLRQVYYPRGFEFPLSLLTPEMLSVEWIREIATIVMLVTISWIAGRNFRQRFSFFLLTFAVWDIFYYVALKLILDWPSSWFTWDILFLIPVPWIGPVLAPIICSLTMILISVLFRYLQEKGVHTSLQERMLILTGSGIIFYTFIRDYIALIIRNGIYFNSDSLEGKEQFRKIITTFIPAGYNWILFIIGELIIIITVIWIIKRSKTK